MSMNLTLECTATGITQRLWQTPTYITDMCLCPPDSPTEDIFRRYSFWVRSHSSGAWKDPKDLDNMRTSIDEHLQEVKNFLEKHPKAKFSYI